MSDTTEPTADLDTDYLDEPICPHCGHKIMDAWEYFRHSHEEDAEGLECGECEGRFTMTQHISISYSTTKESKP